MDCSLDNWPYCHDAIYKLPNFLPLSYPNCSTILKAFVLCWLDSSTGHDRPVFPMVRVQIPLDSTVYLFTLAVLKNHEIFSSCFSEDDSGIECMLNVEHLEHLSCGIYIY